MFLGLDVSTSIVGYALLDLDGKVVENHFWDLRKIKGLQQKADVIESKLKQYFTPYDITHVFIEEPLQMFSIGRSSAGTLLMLASFNGMVSREVNRHISSNIDYINASSARKLCGFSIPRGIKAKEYVMKNILSLDPDFEIEYTKRGNLVKGMYDKADALIVAKAGCISCQLKES